MGVGGGDRWAGGAWSGAVAVASPAERTILPFLEDLISIGGVATAAGFTAQISRVFPSVLLTELYFAHTFRHDGGRDIFLTAKKIKMSCSISTFY